MNYLFFKRSCVVHSYILVSLEMFASVCPIFPAVFDRADGVMLFLFENKRPTIVSIANLFAFHSVSMHLSDELILCLMHCIRWFFTEKPSSV